MGQRYGGGSSGQYGGAPGGLDNAAAVAITGGTIANATVSGTTNAGYILSASGIPFVALSTGSVAAGGAISAITALPTAYPNAYCFFPANALSASSTAGWYYCTFTTTTAGTAFLNTYTSGDPTVPASPTAVTAGQGAFTGATTNLNGPTITVPANALGANGGFRVWTTYSATNNANAKVGRMLFSGSGGTLYVQPSIASVVFFPYVQHIINRGVTNVQTSLSNGQANSSMVSAGSALIGSAVDTTAATSIVIGMSHAVATDNAVIENYLIEVFYKA